MTHIEADPALPIIRITREFQATPARLLRAHTEPDLFARWIGPDSLRTRIEHWDARTGGSFRYVSERDGEEWAFRGCFHEIRPDRLVQTFTYEGDPDGGGAQHAVVRRARRRPHPAPHAVAGRQL
ncbi:SRPBCC domain-containing protein [Paractinoplanes lichenicola]|uniref:SRPBCC domain-containing protein n=1 Tax=Paractinoplanes lichenicola TaxID=2802976 RepID=UPI001F3293D9|nr:SRPBCC domain-containing protein [Actinoplanes lichenicola]